jgi:2-dehydro-3-deoxy-D-gluconate 5-dehydrogenase
MSEGRFAGRRAVVTGAGSGTGRATARRLLDEGAEVLGVDLSEDGLRETFAGRERGGFAALDLTDPASVEQLGLAEADVLVNAAGILRRAHALEHSREDWEATLSVNVRAPYRLAREFARGRLDAGAPGAIVNVCSIESFSSLPAHAAYTASKTAMLMLTRSFALELAPRGVRVNGIAPGVTETGMNAALRADTAASEALMAKIPMRRFGRPEDQAAAICFLASDDAAYVTGAVIAVDGGWLTM